MRKVLILLLFIITHAGNAQGIEFFKGTWEEAMAKAAKEDKLLFVDCFAKWCGPCKRMAKYTFTDKKVGDFFNNNFINLKLDMEEPDGVSFGHKYPVSAYPTLMFLDGDGKLVKKIKGAQQPDQLIAAAKAAIKANDQSGKYAALYEEGKRDFSTVYKYVKALNAAGKPSLKIANEYLDSNPDIDQSQRALFLYEATTEADSKIFDMMLENKELILDQIAEEEFKDKVVDACNATIIKSIEYDADFLLEEAMSKCKKALGKDAELENLKFEVDYYAQMGDDKEYYKRIEKIEKKYAKKEISLYSYLLNKLENRYKKEEKAMDLALEYAKKYYEKEPTPDNAVTYVTVLIEKKDYDEALDIIEKTMEKVEETGADIPKLKSIKSYIEKLKMDSES